MGEGRRLAAIMFTDMVGYTSLSQSDERKAMAFLEEQQGIVRQQLHQHSGREVKTLGDGFLAEFESCLAAVDCAVAIQEAMRARNAERREKDRVSLRAGVHLGEVLEKDGDVYGDTVNIASRIEPLAPVGGVCVTGQVRQNVINKANYLFMSLGRHELRNVTEPLEVYRVIMEWERRRETVRKGSLPVDRVAVLPFVNISPDPNDEYFADGLTEELISKLSQVSDLKVIARTSIMNYKKKEKNASEIGAELGAGTLVEGSIRKAGNKIRVTVQLVDSNTEEHRWSTSYDRTLDDILTVQTDIASRVTESLPVNIARSQVRWEEGGTRNIEAYTAYLKAKQVMRHYTERSVREAIALFQDAVDLDPEFARAYLGLAEANSTLSSEGYVPRAEAEPLARDALERALEISPDLAEAHSLASLFAWFDDDFAKAEAEGKMAIQLNPNLADAYSNLAMLKTTMGYLSESVKLLEKARELNPLAPEIPILGQLYFYTGREEEALRVWEDARKRDPAATCLREVEYKLAKGKLEGARELVADLERMVPDRVWVVGARGMLAAAEGDEEGVRQALRKLEHTFEGVGSMPNYLAYVHYMHGDMDEAFRWLSKAVETHSLIPHVIRYSPLFGRLRADPRYRELLLSNKVDPENKG